MYPYAKKILTERMKIDGDYFLRGGFWLVFAQGATIVASLLSTVALAHYLNEHDFGIYRYVISVSLLLTTFSLTGIGQAIFQATTKGVFSFYKKATSATLQYSSLFVSACIIGSVYYYLNDNTVLSIGCLLIAFITPWSFLFTNIHAFLIGKQAFAQATKIQIAKSFFVALSTVVTLLFTTNVLFLVGIYFLSQAIAGVFFHFLLKPKTNEELSITESGKYLQFAKHTSLRNILVGLSGRIDTILIFQQLGANSLAIFTIATLLPDQIKGSLKNLVTLLIPKFSQHESITTLRRQLPYRSMQVGLILIGLTVMTILVTPIIINTLFPKYSEAIVYAQLLALSFPASVYQIPFAMMQAHTTEKALYSFHIYSAVLQIVITAIGVFFFGIIGAIVARILSQYTQLGVSIYSLYRHTNG